MPNPPFSPILHNSMYRNQYRSYFCHVINYKKVSKCFPFYSQWFCKWKRYLQILRFSESTRFDPHRRLPLPQETSRDALWPKLLLRWHHVLNSVQRAHVFDWRADVPLWPRQPCAGQAHSGNQSRQTQHQLLPVFQTKIMSIAIVVLYIRKFHYYCRTSLSFFRFRTFDVSRKR